MANLKFIAAFLVAISFKLALSQDDCSRERFDFCLDNTKRLTVECLNIRKLNADLNNYCSRVNLFKPQCVVNSCEWKFPNASMISSLYDYPDNICSNERNEFQTLVSCVQNKKSKFETCLDVDEKKAGEIEEVCIGVMSMMCIAEESKKVCDNGEPYAKILGGHLAKLKPVVCNGASLLKSGLLVFLGVILFFAYLL